MTQKHGFLLVNLGSPSAPTAKAVRKYLAQFLSDRRVIPLSPFIWLPILYGFILPTRSSKSAAAYAKVWDKNESGDFVPHSALVNYTFEQAKALRLDKRFNNSEIEIGMRYGSPSVDHGVKSLIERGCEQITVLPLYPQFCQATTLSAFDAIDKAQSTIGNCPPIQCVKEYLDHPKYITSLASSLEQHLEGLDGEADRILVSFHGMPKSAIEQGDPYERHCEQSFESLKLALPHLANKMVLSYQSRFGPKEWLSPYTGQTLAEFASNGVKNVVIIAPGFASDCLETLEELAILEKAKFIENGGKNLSLVPCLNAQAEHIELLADLLLNPTDYLRQE